uniref:hypothetical protein n=1 Tax=Streptomyces bohaiensis TaxID=1431344 RepID=UPI0030C68630
MGPDTGGTGSALPLARGPAAEVARRNDTRGPRAAERGSGDLPRCPVPPADDDGASARLVERGGDLSG